MATYGYIELFSVNNDEDILRLLTFPKVLSLGIYPKIKIMRRTAGSNHRITVNDQSEALHELTKHKFNEATLMYKFKPHLINSMGTCLVAITQGLTLSPTNSLYLSTSDWGPITHDHVHRQALSLWSREYLIDSLGIQNMPNEVTIVLEFSDDIDYEAFYNWFPEFVASLFPSALSHLNIFGGGGLMYDNPRRSIPPGRVSHTSIILSRHHDLIKSVCSRFLQLQPIMIAPYHIAFGLSQALKEEAHLFTVNDDTGIPRIGIVNVLSKRDVHGFITDASALKKTEQFLAI